MALIHVSGNLTSDAQAKEVNGSTVVVFTIADNSRYYTRSGEVKDEVNYFRCAIWAKPELAKLFYKGRPVYATGYLKVSNWTDSEGAKRLSTDVRVTMFKVFGSSKATLTGYAPATQKKHTLQDEGETHVTQAIEQHEQEEAVKDLPF